jgi:hypothetical protein
VVVNRLTQSGWPAYLLLKTRKFGIQ